jgi:hypothetical protein
MVILPTNRRTRQGAMLATEMVVALCILVLTILPMAFAIWHENRLLKACYYRALAMEIVDGEMEVLAAGEWRGYAPGEHRYAVRAVAATNLPPGEFVLTVGEGKARLEWIPQERNRGGRITREAVLK